MAEVVTYQERWRGAFERLNREWIETWFTLEDEQLTRILNADGGPQHWVDRMVTEANRRGGLDNITAIVIRIDSIESSTGEHTTATAAAQSE